MLSSAMFFFCFLRRKDSVPLNCSSPQRVARRQTLSPSHSHFRNSTALFTGTWSFPLSGASSVLYKISQYRELPTISLNLASNTVYNPALVPTRTIFMSDLCTMTRNFPQPGVMCDLTRYNWSKTPWNVFWLYNKTTPALPCTQQPCDTKGDGCLYLRASHASKQYLLVVYLIGLEIVVLSGGASSILFVYRVARQWGWSFKSSFAVIAQIRSDISKEQVDL